MICCPTHRSRPLSIRLQARISHRWTTFPCQIIPTGVPNRGSKKIGIMMLVVSPRTLLFCALVAASLLVAATDATLRGAHSDARKQLGQEEVSGVYMIWLLLTSPLCVSVCPTVRRRRSFSRIRNPRSARSPAHSHFNPNFTTEPASSSRPTNRAARSAATSGTSGACPGRPSYFGGCGSGPAADGLGHHHQNGPDRVNQPKQHQYVAQRVSSGFRRTRIDL